MQKNRTQWFLILVANCLIISLLLYLVLNQNPAGFSKKHLTSTSTPEEASLPTSEEDSLSTPEKASLPTSEKDSLKVTDKADWDSFFDEKIRELVAGDPLPTKERKAIEDTLLGPKNPVAQRNVLHFIAQQDPEYWNPYACFILKYSNHPRFKMLAMEKDSRGRYPSEYLEQDDEAGYKEPQQILVTAAYSFLENYILDQSKNIQKKSLVSVFSLDNDFNTKMKRTKDLLKMMPSVVTQYNVLRILLQCDPHHHTLSQALATLQNDDLKNHHRYQINSGAFFSKHIHLLSSASAHSSEKEIKQWEKDCFSYQDPVSGDNVLHFLVKHFSQSTIFHKFLDNYNGFSKLRKLAKQKNKVCMLPSDYLSTNQECGSTNDVLAPLVKHAKHLSKKKATEKKASDLEIKKIRHLLRDDVTPRQQHDFFDTIINCYQGNILHKMAKRGTEENGDTMDSVSRFCIKYRYHPHFQLMSNQVDEKGNQPHDYIVDKSGSHVLRDKDLSPVPVVEEALKILYKNQVENIESEKEQLLLQQQFKELLLVPDADSSEEIAAHTQLVGKVLDKMSQMNNKCDLLQCIADCDPNNRKLADWIAMFEKDEPAAQELGKSLNIYLRIYKFHSRLQKEVDKKRLAFQKEKDKFRVRKKKWLGIASSFWRTVFDPNKKSKDSATENSNGSPNSTSPPVENVPINPVTETKPGTGDQEEPEGINLWVAAPATAALVLLGIIIIISK